MNLDREYQRPSFLWTKNDAEDDVEFYIKIMEAYKRNVLEIIEKLKKQLDRLSMDQFSFLKHKIKPALITLELSHLLKKLEVIQESALSYPLSNEKAHELIHELSFLVKALDDEIIRAKYHGV